MSIVERALEKAQRRALAEDAAVDGAAQAQIEAEQVPTGMALDVNADQQQTGQSGTGGKRAVVHIAIDQLRQQGELPSVDTERRIAEEYRRIKRPLVARALSSANLADGARNRLIMVASALPGDGKTFTSLNLALSLSLEKDIKLVLIDGDVAKPHISTILGLQGELGLLDVLRDPSLEIDAVIHQTDVPNLSVISAGRRSDTDTELLASKRMEEVMERLVGSDQRRVVLLDSSPLLLTSESRELTRVAGQLVLVVRAGVTPQAAVFEAINSISETCAAGIVLNQVMQRTGNAEYYGYGTYSNYGGQRDSPRDVRNY